MSVRRGKSSEWGREGGWGSVENTAMKLISLACAAIAQLKSSWHVQNTHTTHLHTLKHTHLVRCQECQPGWLCCWWWWWRWRQLRYDSSSLWKSPAMSSTAAGTHAACVCVSVCVYRAHAVMRSELPLTSPHALLPSLSAAAKVCMCPA